MRGTELVGALREPQFRLLWLGQATSTLGDGLVPVALSFAVIQTLNGSATALGVVLAAHILPLVLLRLSLAPRADERRSFLADLKGGWHELVTHTWLWVIVVWASTYLFAVVAPFMTLGPVVAKQSLGGAAAWGMIAAGWGAGSL